MSPPLSALPPLLVASPPPPPRPASGVAGGERADLLPLGSALLGFLRRLSRHADREWLRAHRAEHEEAVVLPLRALLVRWVAVLGPLIPGLAPDAHRRGLLRVYRDARFVAAGASPFHGRVGLQLRHRASTAGAPAPSVTLRLEPGASALQIGLPRAAPGAMRLLRGALIDDPVLWSQLAGSMEVAGGRWIGAPGVLPRSLARAPAHLHPFLTRRTLAVEWPLTDTQVAEGDLTAFALPLVEAAAPLLRFQCLALGLQAGVGSTLPAGR